MSISKSIEAAKTASAKPRTMFKSFYEWYDALSPEDRQELDSALLSEEVSARQLFMALKEHEGVPFGDNAFYYHRRVLRQEKEI